MTWQDAVKRARAAWKAGQTTVAVQQVVVAARLAEDHPETAARLWLLAAELLGRQGHLREAEHLVALAYQRISSDAPFSLTRRFHHIRFMITFTRASLLEEKRAYGSLLAAWEVADTRAAEALAVCVEQGSWDDAVGFCLRRADIAHERVLWREAWLWIRNAFLLVRHHQLHHRVPHCLARFAHVYRALGNDREASRLYRLGHVILRKQGAAKEEAVFLWNWAYTLAAQGCWDEAKDVAEQAVARDEATSTQKLARFEEWMHDRQTRRAGLDYPPQRENNWPIDHEDVQYWTIFWETHAPDATWWEFRLEVNHTVEVLKAVRARGCRSVLFLGNGGSFEPYLFARAGMDVTVVELSANGTAHAQAVSKDILKEIYAKVGLSNESGSSDAIHWITGSLFDMSLCPGPFDCIISRRTFQYFEGSVLATALEAVRVRLALTGVIILHAHNAYPSVWNTELWLGEHMSVSTDYDVASVLMASPKQQVAWLRGTSGIG